MAKFLENTSDINRSIKKKKKKQETVTKPQSPSAPKQQRAKQAQNQKTYGGMSQPQQQTVKRPSTSSSKSTSKNVSQQTQRTVDRLQQKYGTNNQSRTASRPQSQPKRYQPHTAERLSERREQIRADRNRANSNQATLDRLQDRYGRNKGHSTWNERKSLKPEQTETAKDRLQEKFATGTVRGGEHTALDKASRTAYRIGHGFEQGAELALTENKKVRNKLSNPSTANKFYNRELNPEDMEKNKKKLQLRDEGLRQKILAQQEEMNMWAQSDEGSYLEKMAIQGAQSAGGMAVDALAGPMSLIHMGVRVTEGSYVAEEEKVRKLRQRVEESGQYTPEEIDEMFKDMDKRIMASALSEAAIEVLTEKMFGGIGMASKVVGGKGFLDAAASKLTGRLGASVAGRMLRGTAEEIAEEEIGNPAQAFMSNLIMNNRLNEINQDVTRRGIEAQSTDLISRIGSEEDARAVAANLNSERFLDEAAAGFRESGASKKEAQELAEMTRDYLYASVTGDSEKAEEIREKMVDKLAGEEQYKEKWTLQDAIDVAVSTGLMTAATGAPGAITSAAVGANYKAEKGVQGVKKLAELTKSLDPEKSARAQAVIDRIDSGKDVSNSQVYEIMSWSQEATAEATKREQAKDSIVRRKMEEENLLVPASTRASDGSYMLSPKTEDRFEQIADETMEKFEQMTIEDSETELSEEDKYTIADAVAAFQTGTITAEQINELNYDRPAARKVFQEVTGIDLDQYNEKTKAGNINEAASNVRMQEALFARAAENYVESARAEQVHWDNVTRGEYVEQLESNNRMGSEGSKALTEAIKSVDPRDQRKLMRMGAAANSLYERALYSNDSWEDVRAEAAKNFSSLDISALKAVFDSGKADRAIQETAFYGRAVKANEKLTKKSLAEAEQVAVPGEVVNKTGRTVTADDLLFLQSVADTLNIKVEAVDIEPRYEGWFKESTGVLTVNLNEGVKKPLRMVVTHELTHSNIYAPDEFMKLLRYIGDAWYKADPAGYKAAIDERKARYKKDQELNDLDALEEIVADGSIDYNFWNDEDLAATLATEDPGLAQKFLNAIRELLRKIRSILANQPAELEDDRVYTSLYADAIDMAEAERLMLNALKAARQVRNENAIDAWDAEARGETAEDYENELEAERFSIVEDPQLIKQLESDDHITTYRGMVKIDGKYYSPMSSKVRNEEGRYELREGMEPGQWVEAELTTDPKMFYSNGDYKLMKDNGKSIPAAYNPYMHSSDSMMNDQFATQYKRPNLVVVEGVIPASEINNGIRVEHDLDDGRHVVAKDPTGIAKWKPGPIEAKLPKDRQRTVYLSNHFKMVREVPAAEVALHIYDKLDGTDVSITYNVVTPELREELQKLGTKMEQSKEAKYFVEDAEAPVRYSINDTDYMDAVESGDMETAQRMVEQAAREAGYTTRAYHGTPAGGFTKFDGTRSHIAYRPTGFNYFTDNLDLVNKYYAVDNNDFSGNKQVYDVYLRMDNPLEIQADGAGWNSISLPEDMRRKGINKNRYGEWDTASTDQIARYARNNGYDAVVFHDVRDGTTKDEPSTVYAIMESNQIKDSAPVTYDDSGNVIPLSERFNQENPDIRYSLSEDTTNEILSAIGPDVRFSTSGFRDEKAKAKFIAGLNSGKGGFAGLSEIASGRDILRRTMNKKGFSEKQTDAVVGFLEHMADYLEDESLQMKYHFIGWKDISDGEVTVRRDADGNIVSVAVSAMVVNGEYPVNFDLTTICNKREGVMEVIQALTQKYDEDTGRTILNSIKLTDEKMWSINEALKREGIDTACLGCFVEARRYYTNRFIDKIDSVWNSAVREARRQLGLPEEVYFDFAKGRKVTGEDYNKLSDLWTAYDESTESKRSPAQRIKILMDEIVKNKEVDSPYLKLISAEDILTPEGIRGFKELSTHNKDRDMVKMIKSIYGTSAPKEILAFTPYNSEIALLPDKIKGMDTGEYLKSIGGTRVQSFSDFKMEHFFDHMQMVADEAARRFVNHGYSKVIAYPRLFGLTGRKINMSVMFDVLPVAEWQNVLGCSPAAAVEVAQKYQGLRFVKEKPAENPDNRPYKEVEIEGVHGYLTYLVSDADYVNSVFDRLYQENLDAGMTPDEARRQANKDKPFEQSINYSEAVELENRDGYKENVGIIAVAFGDEHLRMLLDDPNVRYIIPYHRSGLPVFIAQKTALDIARNYTDYQNTNKAKRGIWTSPEGVNEKMKSKYAKFVAEHPELEYPAITFFETEINGKGYTVEFGKKSSKEKITLAGTGTFDVYENLEKVKDIREISNAYLEHCIDNNQVPVFHEFAGHPNYYKMLFDFAVTDGTTDHIFPQKPVRNIYPGLNLDEIVASGRSIEDLTPDDFAEFYKEIEQGLADQNAKTELRRSRLGRVLDDDLLSRDGENSIIADSNIQHIVNGTPDYTSVRYAHEDTIPEETGEDIRRSISEIYDDAYMDAVNSGNMEEAQRLVGEAAERAGYNRLQYHQTQNIFTEFDIEHGGNSDGEKLFPYGIFTKRTNADIGIEGSIQMPLYVKANNVLSARDREHMISILPQEYKDIVSRITDLQAKYESQTDDLEWDMVEALEEYYEAHPDIGEQHRSMNVLDMMEAQKSIPDEEYQKLQTEYDSIMAEWEGQEFDLIAQARAYVTSYLRANGYDGFEVDIDAGTLGRFTDTLVLLDRNQVKSADPVTYAEDGSVIPLSERFDPNNNDIRYSMSTVDSDGNVLSDGQMEFFKNSQARDAEGKLLPMYHFTRTAGFTVFDPTRAFDGVSISFSDDYAFASNYASEDGDIDEIMEAGDNRYGEQQEEELGMFDERPGYYECYLNLTNPYVYDGRDMDSMDPYDVAALAYSNSYDGVIIKDFEGMGSDIYMVFHSEQVKDTRNTDPTNNPDIRFSLTQEDDIIAYASENAESTDELWYTDPELEEGRVRYSMSKQDFIEGKTRKWNPAWLTEGRVLQPKSVEKSIREVVMGAMAQSDTPARYRQTLVKSLVVDAQKAFAYMKDGKESEAAALLYDSAHEMIESAKFFMDDDAFNRYKELRDYFSNFKISIEEKYYSDIDIVTYRRNNMRNILVGSNGTMIDEIWEDLCDKWPEYFSMEVEHPVEMLEALEHAFKVAKPVAVAYSSEEAMDFAGDIADDLYDIVYEGKELVSLADKYQAKAKAMKQRHKEAMQDMKQKLEDQRERQAYEVKQLKEENERKLKTQKAKYEFEIAELKQNREYNIKRLKAENRRALKEERQKRKDEKNREKARLIRSHMIDKLTDDYNWLVQRVLDPTKDKYVPEEFRKSLAEFLQMLDLQTENSKKLEAKTGRVSQKTFKLRELKDRLENMAKTKNEDGVSMFELDSYVPYILESLTEKTEKYGGTIDSLDISDVKEIGILMKAIRHNLDNYNKRIKAEKTEEISAIGENVVKDQLKRVEKRGAAKKYGGTRDTMDIINTAALTPVNFFDRLGPAMKSMYDELRYEGFDTYVRNEQMIIRRLNDILGKYHKQRKFNKNKPKPGSTIEEWRDDRSLHTIQLKTNPEKTIEMTTAQIMSLYCLQKRKQALQHMLKGGIHITPIQSGSKIQRFKDREKGKVESAESVPLTIEDIQEIVAQLTPEQKQIADDLQQLMAVDMAKLGNQAHREMYGYEIFDDPEYFPIKSRSNEIATDVNNVGEVVEKIKSFGPAKPLDPKASNIIEVDDIFSVVADHCNGMNLYNAYLVPISDFVRVYNAKIMQEDGRSLSVKDALEMAHGKKAMTYINNFLRDINGIKAVQRGGLEDVMNKALGTAKRTAVFGNIRVALQQPTAIVRALAVMDPKHFAPLLKVKPQKGVAEEMRTYCPIAQWKAWGFYDTYMGRDIEDVMMNNWSGMDVALSGIYGELDNWTWSLIWRAVKAEQAKAHPDMDTKSEEFLQMCGRRASEVFDRTQVVDSTFHRSDAMRSKQVAVKTFTAFMAEPTLTLNVFRAGIENAREEWLDGNKGKAMGTFSRAFSVIILQAAIVAAAQSFADAWRDKDPGWPGDGDDDDKEKESDYWTRWVNNYVANLFDGLHLENNIYLVKDITPYFNYMISKIAEHGDWNPWVRAAMGWDQEYLYGESNLVMSALENTATGVSQIYKKIEKGDEYEKTWYDIVQKTVSGPSTFLGFPLGTLMRDTKPIWKNILGVTFADDGSAEIPKPSRQIEGIDDGSTVDNILNHFGINLSPAEQKAKSDAERNEEIEKQIGKISDKAAGLTGLDKDKKIWSAVTTFYKDDGHSISSMVENGNYSEIYRMQSMYTRAGGDSEYFVERVMAESKKALKKSIIYDPTEEQIEAQRNVREYLLGHGMSEQEISDIVYKSNTAKEMKIAFRLNDKDAMMEELKPLVMAGLTYQDLERLWENRKRVNLKTYNGKYKDRLKSTGTYNWPINGQITSRFGHRSSPGGIGSTNHQGLDIAGNMGDPVGAADGGTVIYSGWYGGAGKTVMIEHDDGTVTQYSHLSWYEAKVGDVVAQGQTVGNVGSTGNSTGPHLHFGVKVNGSYVDPLEYLNS